MRYYARLHADGRWGIYAKRNLLATIGSQQECRAIIRRLNRRQPKKQRLRKRYLQFENPQATPYRVRRLSLPHSEKAIEER